MNGRTILRVLRNSLMAILKGEFLIRIRCDKYFPHIIYTFFLLWMMIWLNLKIETTMAKVERNKEKLGEMKIYHAQKTVSLVSLNRISTVERLLEEHGSDVGLPEKPADRIETD